MEVQEYGRGGRVVICGVNVTLEGDGMSSKDVSHLCQTASAMYYRRRHRVLVPND